MNPKTSISKRETLMSGRHSFEIVCPNNHNQTVKFNQEEFESVLKSGTLVFHCNTGDTDWSPSGAEIAMFRKEFRKERSEDEKA
jgi:hypothetical protein